MLAGQRGEGGVELVPAQAEAPALDDHPHEEGAVLGVADVLVGAEDVAVMQGDEAGDGGDQAPVVGAVDQESDIVAHGRQALTAWIAPDDHPEYNQPAGQAATGPFHGRGGGPHEARGLV